MTRQLIHARVLLLGVPVDVETNADPALAAVASCFGSLPIPDGGPASDAVTPPRPHLRLILDDATNPDAPLRFQSIGRERLEIQGPGFRGHADARSLTAHAAFNTRVLASRERLEETIVATLSLFLVTRLDRQPLHAAALWRDGRLVLLSGPSGAGKSTLAYAALRVGWTVLADDVVYLQSEPEVRIWVRPARLHLPLDAGRWFPELENRIPIQRENGKWKISIPTANRLESMPPIESKTLYLLEPGEGGPATRELAVEDAIAILLRDMDQGFDVFRDTIGPVLRRFLHGGNAFVVRTGSGRLFTF